MLLHRRLDMASTTEIHGCYHTGGKSRGISNTSTEALRSPPRFTSTIALSFCCWRLDISKALQETWVYKTLDDWLHTTKPFTTRSAEYCCAFTVGPGTKKQQTTMAATFLMAPKPSQCEYAGDESFITENGHNVK